MLRSHHSSSAAPHSNILSGSNARREFLHDQGIGFYAGYFRVSTQTANVLQGYSLPSASPLCRFFGCALRRSSAANARHCDLERNIFFWGGATIHCRPGIPGQCSRMNFELISKSSQTISHFCGDSLLELFKQREALFKCISISDFL